MPNAPFLHNKPYTGKIQAVIFDWAGTTIDHGCLGPAAVFDAAFQRFGIEPTLEEIRAPMGMEKHAHVESMLAMPRISQLWRELHNSLPGKEAGDQVFQAVLELMPATLASYARPVPGCLEALAELRGRGIKIGSCTGYSRSMMKELLPLAEQAGFKPDCLVTADEAPAGRPWPWMCWLNCMRLGVFPLESIVKVGDTIADIEEGINAGHWSVAVTDTSNAMGLNEEEIQQIDADILAQKRANLAKQFYAAGAHLVIPGISGVSNACDLINERLAAGEKPVPLADKCL